MYSTLNKIIHAESRSNPEVYNSMGIKEVKNRKEKIFPKHVSTMYTHHDFYSSPPSPNISYTGSGARFLERGFVWDSLRVVT